MYLILLNFYDLWVRARSWLALCLPNRQGQRFRIETMFSDFKGRGFQLQKSGLVDPVRVSRLLIAVSLAYVWVIALGVYALKTEWNKIVHRTDRCGLSLFELGKRLLKRHLKNNKALPPIDAFLIIKI
jgi:hypothetical protein